jgi:opacity protein-like surface antigen
MLMLFNNLRSTSLVGFGVVFMLFATRASADQHGWTFDFGAGTTPTTGEIRSRLTTGWNVDFRAGHDFSNGLGLIGDVTYNGFGVTNEVLQSLQVPNGNARLWSVTAGPRWRFSVGDNVHPYVLGGVGWYRRTVDFTQPTVGVIDVIDPWWGYIGSVLVPANQILGSVTKDAVGANAGGGVSVTLGDSGVALFVEARYQFANTKPTSTAAVPVTFGMHWGGRSTTSRP